MDLNNLFGDLGANILGNTTLQAIVLVTLLDFAFGTIKSAITTGPDGKRKFNIEWLDAWVGDHLVKVIMITLAMIFGEIAPPVTVGTFDINIVGITAETAAIAYLAKTVASIIGNLQFTNGVDAPPASVADTAVIEALEDQLTTPTPTQPIATPPKG